MNVFTKKRVKEIVLSLVFLLFFSSFSTPVANAQYVVDKNEALATSTYYSIKTQRIALNKQEALKKILI